jgi:hypothetical protein
VLTSAFHRAVHLLAYVRLRSDSLADALADTAADALADTAADALADTAADARADDRRAGRCAVG